jgi:hypothetical protein
MADGKKVDIELAWRDNEDEDEEDNGPRAVT